MRALLGAESHLKGRKSRMGGMPLISLRRAPRVDPRKGPAEAFHHVDQHEVSKPLRTWPSLRRDDIIGPGRIYLNSPSSMEKGGYQRLPIPHANRDAGNSRRNCARRGLVIQSVLEAPHRQRGGGGPIVQVEPTIGSWHT